MSKFERHCRWLLLAYPRWYRKDRGDEIVDILLQSTGPDRSWPDFRDSRTLILAGLRVRAGMQQRLSVRANLAQALLLAAVLVLAEYSATYLRFAQGEWNTFPSWLFSWINLVLGLATLAVMIGAWFGPTRVVAIAAIATACLLAYQPPDDQIAQAIVPMIALGIIALLVYRRQRLPRPWLWLALIWYLMLQTPGLFRTSNVVALGLAVILVMLVWSAVDARPMLAMTLTLAIGFGGSVLVEVASWGSRPGFRLGDLVVMWPAETIAATSILFVVVAIWRLRRQALL
jgi:hypothetical protein